MFIYYFINFSANTAWRFVIWWNNESRNTKHQ